MERQYRILPSDSSTGCQEHLRLLELYKEAAAKLTAAGAALSDCAMSYEADLFSRAWSINQDAWHECSRCRHELQQHMVRHRC
jgi:hypothetical protein